MWSSDDNHTPRCHARRAPGEKSAVKSVWVGRVAPVIMCVFGMSPLPHILQQL